MKKDRIENAIRHIQTATDVDPWAAELAVEALKAQLSEEDTTSDCISRQAAIKVMTSVLWHLPNECYRHLNEYEFSKGLAELGLNSVPSVQPEPKWIPCSERLPEEYGNYITTMNYGDVQECTYSPEKNTRFMRGGWSTCEHDGILFLDASEVIAWMPLPEPYRAERRTDETD